MDFSTEDQDLVEIVEAVGDVAIASKDKRKESKDYIDILVRAYVNDYVSSNGTLPGKSLFGEAVNWYVNDKFHDGPKSIAKMVKGIMREMIFDSFERYRKQLRTRAYDHDMGLAFG